jgi:hypothetical protein
MMLGPRSSTEIRPESAHGRDPPIPQGHDLDALDASAQFTSLEELPHPHCAAREPRDSVCPSDAPEAKSRAASGSPSQ